MIRVSDVLDSSRSYFVKKTTAKNQSEAIVKLKPFGSKRLLTPPIIAVRAFTIGAVIVATVIRTIVTTQD